MKIVSIGASTGLALLLFSTTVEAQQEKYCISNAAQSDSYFSWSKVTKFFSSLTPQSLPNLRASRVAALRQHIMRVISAKLLFIEVVELDLGKPIPRWSEETIQRIPHVIKEIGSATEALRDFSAANDTFASENAFIELKHHLESRKSITLCKISNAAAHQQFEDMRRYVNRLKEELRKISEADVALAEFMTKLKAPEDK